MSFRNVCATSTLLTKNYIYFTNNINRCIKTQPRNNPKNKTMFSFQCKSFLNFSNYPPPKCWQCNYPYKSEIFCSKCKALQKLPEDLNYFDIFGVKKDFDIDVEDIKKKYRQLQSILHPDKFEQKSNTEKEISKNLSSLINKVYKTLLDPLDRGLYLLKLNNVFIQEGTSSEAGFLMEIMEINEKIEEASKSKEKILELSKTNHKTLDSLNKKISQAFLNKDIDRAKELLMKMKYYVSIDKRLKILKQDLDIVD